MNKFKRIMALVLAMSMMLALVACGSANTPSTTEASDAASVESTAAPETEAVAFDPRSITEGVTLTIAVPSDDEVIDWETNLVTKMLEEKFGVDLVFEEYASAGFKDKLNVMIQGGAELPDIIFGANYGDIDGMYSSWTSSGAILDLTDYYENPEYAEYVKYYNEAAEAEGVDILAGIRDADGRVWAVPKYKPSPNDATPCRMWVNSEYAKKLGYDEIPTDTEGFFEMCKAFVEAGDINGNGLDDEVVFTGSNGGFSNWVTFLMSAYVYSWDDWKMVAEDGKLTYAFATDRYKEALKYIKRFFDEGILDTTILTQDNTARNTIQRDPAEVFLCDFGFRPLMTTGTQAETYATYLKYDFVTQLEGPYGKNGAVYNDVLSKVGAMITTDCENPDAAMLVMDYMLSETISLCNRYGEQGVDWDYWADADQSKLTDDTTLDMYKSEQGDKDPVFISYTNATYWGQGNPQNSGYMNAGPFILRTDANAVAMEGGETEDAKTVAAWLKKLWSDCVGTMVEEKREERIITLPLTAEENEEVAEASLVLNNYWNESFANFVTGKWDIDEQWDEYLVELEKIGMNDLLEVYQTAFDRTK